MESLEKQIRELEQKKKELQDLKTAIEAKSSNTMNETDLKTEITKLEEKLDTDFKDVYKPEEKEKVKKINGMITKANTADLSDIDKDPELLSFIKEQGIKIKETDIQKKIDDKVLEKKKEIDDIVTEINVMADAFSADIATEAGKTLTTEEPYFLVMKKHDLAKKAIEKINQIYDILDKIKLKTYVETKAKKLEKTLDYVELEEESGKGSKPYLKKTGASSATKKITIDNIEKEYGNFLATQEINFGNSSPAPPFTKTTIIEGNDNNLKLISEFLKELAKKIKDTSDSKIDADYKADLEKKMKILTGGSRRSEMRRVGRHMQRGGDLDLFLAILRKKFDLLRSIALSGTTTSIADLLSKLAELQAQKEKEEEKLKSASKSKSSKSSDKKTAFAILSYVTASNKYDDKLLTYCSNVGIDKSTQYQLVFAVNKNQVRNILQDAGIAKSSVMQTIMELKRASAIKKYKEGWGNYIPGSMGMVPFPQSGMNIGVTSMPIHSMGFVRQGTTVLSPSNITIRY